MVTINKDFVDFLVSVDGEDKRERPWVLLAAAFLVVAVMHPSGAPRLQLAQCFAFAGQQNSVPIRSCWSRLRGPRKLGDGRGCPEELAQEAPCIAPGSKARHCSSLQYVLAGASAKPISRW